MLFIYRERKVNVEGLMEAHLFVSNTHGVGGHCGGPVDRCRSRLCIVDDHSTLLGVSATVSTTNRFIRFKEIRHSFSWNPPFSK